MVLICDKCKKAFERNTHLYRLKTGSHKNIFCSRQCALGFRVKKLSSFNVYLRRCKRTATVKDYEFDLDIPYLEKVWKEQRGTCPYTGLMIILPKNASSDQALKSMEKASLDRIDSSKGYIKGNVEFVCLGANWAKSNFSKEEALAFFNKIKKQAAVKQPASIFAKLVD